MVKYSHNHDNNIPTASCYIHCYYTIVIFVFQVQIRPWNLGDSDFVMDGSQPLDPRKTIFVGGVPRPLRACKCSNISLTCFNNYPPPPVIIISPFWGVGLAVPIEGKCTISLWCFLQSLFVSDVTFIALRQ